MARRWADSIVAKIKTLPPENATGSRDFGRGYMQAVKDIIEIIERENNAQNQANS